MLAGPFVGSEALESGLVGKYELRTRFTLVYPDVYVPAGVKLSLAARARAAWLWSHREGVIAGLTASGLDGAKWIDECLPTELVWPNARPPRGLRTHDYRLSSDEFLELDGCECAHRNAPPLTLDVEDSWAKRWPASTRLATRRPYAFRTSPKWAVGTRVLGACDNYPRRSIFTMRARSHRRRPGCDCCSSKKVSRGPGRRYQYSGPTVRTTTSTWGGRT